MKKSKLEILYDFIASSKELHIDLPDDVLRQTAEMEERIIREDVLPVLRDKIEPTLSQIKRELILVTEYHPGEPISVRISRKRNLSDLSDAIVLTPDPVVEHREGITHNKKGPISSKTNLKVTIPNGKVFFNKTAAETFCQVIEYAGLQQVRSIGMSFCGVPIVSTSQDAKYKRAQRKTGNIFIMHHSSTRDKAKQLKQISDALNIDLKIEIV